MEGSRSRPALFASDVQPNEQCAHILVHRGIRAARIVSREIECIAFVCGPVSGYKFRRTFRCRRLEISHNNLHDVAMMMVSKVANALPYSSLWFSSNKCVTNFVFSSAVIRVPGSLLLSSEGIQRWYARLPSARQYDCKCLFSSEFHSAEIGSIQKRARSTKCHIEKVAWCYHHTAFGPAFECSKP